MQVKLDYGRDGLDVHIPDRNLEAVLTLKPARPVPDAPQAVRDALTRPIGCPPLAALARGRESACVVISDITRPVPNRVILPSLLGTLEMCGISRDRITILIATGTHRPCTNAEIREMVGIDIASNYRIENHDALDVEGHRYLGGTPLGVPIWVDTRFLDADLRISIALIEPHFMAGFSGGRKSVCPGICSMETVKVWHGPKFIGHERAQPGVVEGNPVHEDAHFVATKAGLDFICDVTIDADRSITGVFAGDPDAAWQRGVSMVRSIVEAELPAPVDVVITSAAGYPLDMTFYQAVKGMVGALPAVKEGGTVIIASECMEGIGGKHFRETLDHIDDLNEFVAKTGEAGFFVPDQWQIHELQKALSRANVMVFSEGITSEELRSCFVTPIDSVEDGIRLALDKHGFRARIVVIPKGPYVIPVISE